jgi:hypothetical protein
MDESNIHEGGCLCGAVRYRVSRQPEFALACHCRYCQKRHGIALGTLDEPDLVPITHHLWLRSIRPWVRQPDGVERMEKGYSEPRMPPRPESPPT